MRRTIASVTTPGRWRRRRTARMALAAALVMAAPFIGRSDPAETSGPAPHGGAAASASSHGDAPQGPVRVVPVALADPGVADLLQPGDLVDLVSTVDAGAVPDARDAAAGDLINASVARDPVVVRAARVRDIPDGRSGGRSVLVEVPEDRAAHVAATAATSPLAVVVHG